MPGIVAQAGRRRPACSLKAPLLYGQKWWLLAETAAHANGIAYLSPAGLCSRRLLVAGFQVALALNLKERLVAVGGILGTTGFTICPVCLVAKVKRSGGIFGQKKVLAERASHKHFHPALNCAVIFQHIKLQS